MSDQGKRHAARLAAGLFTVLALGVAIARADGPGLVEAGPTPDLVLVYSGDVIGYLEPCG